MTEDTLPPPDLGIAAIIPLYNGAKYIREALTSVLAQHLPPSEIVVVDDGSTDDGPRIVAEMAATHPIRLLHKQNGGQASARNFGVAATTSRLIALLDQDDIWYPDHLQELAEPFLSRSNVPLGWVYGNLDEIDERGNVIARAILSSEGDRHPKRTLIACLREDMFVLPSASLISRAAFESVGGFDEQLRGYEDDDLFLRLFHAGFDNVYVDKPLSQWRIYPSSASYSPQMAKSRMVYATRLLNRFPDDPERRIDSSRVTWWRRAFIRRWSRSAGRRLGPVTTMPFRRALQTCNSSPAFCRRTSDIRRTRLIASYRQSSPCTTAQFISSKR